MKNRVATLFASNLSIASEALLRVVSGVALVTHGYGKITDPMGNIAMVEGIGFHPGFFWSPALAVTEFFGGLLLVLGLLTRPAAAGAFVILAVASWFHWAHLEQGYPGAEKAILWAAICLLFVARGGGKLSLDRAIQRFRSGVRGHSA